MECQIDTPPTGAFYTPFHCNGRHSPIQAQFQGDCGHFHHHPYMNHGNFAVNQTSPYQNGGGAAGNATPHFIGVRRANSIDVSAAKNNVASSLTTQPFVPKQVMDIARPTPINKGPSSNTRREQAGTPIQAQTGMCRCGFCNVNMNDGSQMNHEACCYNVPVERSRPIETNRQSTHFADHANFMTQNGCCQNDVGSAFETDFPAPANNMTRSRSNGGVWGRSAMRSNESDYNLNNRPGSSAAHQNLGSQMSNGMNGQAGMMHQVYTIPNQTGHCHCMNPNCPVHNSQQGMAMMNGTGGMVEAGPQMTPGYHRSRSYEVLDGLSPMNGMINGFGNLNMGTGGVMSTKKKAPLPPASHHSPEQRTSYREHGRL